MKFKPTLLAVAATMALACQTHAEAPPTTTRHSDLSITGIITTNGASVEGDHSTTYPVNTSKFNNKTLLDLFAQWQETTWPAGAKLVIGWDLEGAVLVVDKTGTNILFNASADANDYSEGAHWFVVDFFNEGGAYEGIWDNGNPGSGHWRTWNQSYFELYDDGWVLPYTDLWADGGSTQHSTQSWDKNGSPLSWHDTETADFLFTGGQYFRNVGSDATVSGHITADGHGDHQWSPFDN